MRQMRYLEIKGKNDMIRMSKNIIGTTYFGTEFDKGKCFTLLDRYFELGGNCIDTARSYAQWIEGGDSASEKVIGQWFESRKLREKTVLSTKGAFYAKDGTSRVNSEAIIEDIGQSLECLKTKYIDIYFLHRDDINADIEDIMYTLDSFVKKGTIKALGASNWTVERIEYANNIAKANNFTPFSVSQIHWNAAFATPESLNDYTLVCMNDNEYSWYLKNRFPVMAFSSQAKGLFSKAIEQGIDSLNKKIIDRFLCERNVKKIEWVKSYCERFNVSPATAILSFINSNPVPAASIIGCSSVEQLEDSMRNADFVMSAEDIKALNSI